MYKRQAYVCELTPDQMREMRGDLTHPAVSPYRDRPMEESLDLFARMRAGEFEDGRMTLRAKIDLNSGNFNMRDPVIYRINHTPVSYTHLDVYKRQTLSRVSGTLRSSSMGP